MKDRGNFRNRLAEAFRAPDAPTLITRPLRKSTMVATELRCDRPNFGRTQSMPREDAYLIALQLRPCHDHDLYFDGRRVRPQNYAAGATSIYDLRTDPIADLRDPYHSIMFHLPRKALDAIAYEAGVPWIGDLRHEPGRSVDDSVVRHLLTAVLAATARPHEASPLFLDHLALALIAHLAHRYGGLRADDGLPRGGLTPRQERRVKELMSATPMNEVPLSRLAEECGVSVRHFTRAFRQSTRLSPHRWLLKYRVEHARELLSNRGLTLAEIALACGFADQSHFTRVFTAIAGVSPGVWRRVNGVTPQARNGA